MSTHEQEKLLLQLVRACVSKLNAIYKPWLGEKFRIEQDDIIGVKLIDKNKNDIVCNITINEYSPRIIAFHKDYMKHSEFYLNYSERQQIDNGPLNWFTGTYIIEPLFRKFYPEDTFAEFIIRAFRDVLDIDISSLEEAIVQLSLIGFPI